MTKATTQMDSSRRPKRPKLAKATAPRRRSAPKLRAPKLDPLIAIIRTGIPGYDPYRDAGECTFDIAKATRAIQFFERFLTHSKGRWAGKPFTLADWQKAIVANLFGWINPDGTRRYREALIYVARKNGKSLLCAGLALYLLLCDGEAGAEIYTAAADRSQARLVFDAACQMVGRSPDLAKRASVFAHEIKSVADAAAMIKPLSSEAYSKHGFNAHGILIDELHALGSNVELVDVLTTSIGARSQPLTVYITTADFVRESACNTKLKYARGVRDGAIADPTFLPVIYALDAEDDWTDEANWAKANPNLGVSVSLEYLRSEYRKAITEPSRQTVFRKLHLNQQTDAQSIWIDGQAWRECGAPVDVGPGEPCWVGVDLALGHDFTAAALLFRPRADGEPYRVLMRYWYPEGRARQRGHEIGIPLEMWIAQGLVKGTPGDATDEDTVLADLQEIAATYQVQDFAFDRYRANAITSKLLADGLPVQLISQTIPVLCAPSAELERRVMNRQIAHGGNHVLAWMMGNCSVQYDGKGNFMPHRTDPKHKKIDGVAALVNAIAREIEAPAVSSGSLLLGWV